MFDESVVDKNSLYAIGVGDPVIIKKIVKRYSNELTFPNLIHPNVIFDKDSVSFGKGNIICPGTVLTTCIDIGSFNLFNLNVTIGHDTNIDDGNVFNPGCNISGGVKIGSHNLFGTNSTVLQGLNIKNDSIVGASALLTKNLESNLLAIGVPAKF